MEARDREVGRRPGLAAFVAGAAVAAIGLALGTAAAGAGAARFATARSAEANHGALGRYLVAIHDSEKGDGEAVKAAGAFLSGSKLEWIAALREAAFVVPGEKRPTALLRVLEPTGNSVAEIPLPAKDEEIGEKLKGHLFKRGKPDPAASFRKPDAPAFELAPPAGWTLADIGEDVGGECVLAGPEDRRATLGTSLEHRPLVEIEGTLRQLLEAGGFQKLSPAQYTKSRAESGRIKASYSTPAGPKGFTILEVLPPKKKDTDRAVLAAAVVGKGASEKETEALLAHLKKGYKP